MADDLPILGRCAKCGREFVGLPARLPATDSYAPQGFRRVKGEPLPICGGRIELTTEGVKQMSAQANHQ